VDQQPGKATLRLRRLVLSEMLKPGDELEICFCGACNIVSDQGTTNRNTGRDALHEFADEQDWTFFEVQVHPRTHGRDYIYEIDGDVELEARKRAKLRVYEIRPEVPGIITCMEVLQDAVAGRQSIVWLRSGAKEFNNPILGNKKAVKNDDELKHALGESKFALVLQLVSGVSLQRQYMIDMLDEVVDKHNIVIVDDDDVEAVKREMKRMLSED